MIGFNGTDIPTPAPTEVPTPVPTLNRRSYAAAKIALGAGVTLVINENGGTWACGTGYYGRLGDGVHNDANFPRLTRRVNIANIKKLAVDIWPAYAPPTVALTESGRVFAWPGMTFESLGQSGYGIFEVTGFTSEPVDVAVGCYVYATFTTWGHIIIALADGSVMAIGKNAEMALGDGTSTDQSELVPVLGLPNRTETGARFTSVAARGVGGCAAGTHGVYCWVRHRRAAGRTEARETVMVCRALRRV